jgi:hypothetical protein
MIEHIEYTNNALQNEAVDLLKALGADSGRLWLVEVQNYEQFKKFYGKTTADDYFNSKDQFIIYYHESGSVHSHSLFNPDDQEEFEAAVENIAKYLN